MGLCVKIKPFIIFNLFPNFTAHTLKFMKPFYPIPNNHFGQFIKRKFHSVYYAPKKLK
jgi:hypothetical protein